MGGHASRRELSEVQMFIQFTQLPWHRQCDLCVFCAPNPHSAPINLPRGDGLFEVQMLCQTPVMLPSPHREPQQCPRCQLKPCPCFVPECSPRRRPVNDSGALRSMLASGRTTCAPITRILLKPLNEMRHGSHGLCVTPCPGSFCQKDN
jgi:hypothetical protein